MLRSDMRTVVIDATYYGETLTRRFDSEKLRSGHLYQLFAYLKNLEARGDTDREAEGILMYPCVEQELDHRYRVPGHDLRIRTLDLAAPWPEIRRSLLRVLERPQESNAVHDADARGTPSQKPLLSSASEATADH